MLTTQLPLTVIPVADLTIANGGTNSNILNKSQFGDGVSVTLYGPAALDSATFTIQVSPLDNAVAGDTWYTWNNNAADVGPPAATKAVVYDFSDFGSIKIHSSGAVAADRTWKVTKRG